MDSSTILKFSSIPFLGIACQWLAWRFKAPSILILLIAGMIVGPFLGLINSDDLLGPLLFPVISLSTAIILFEGGLSLKFSEIKGTRVIVKNLISKGVIISWLIITGSLYLLFDYDYKVSFLLGSLFVMTGPTVVLPLLRHVRVTDKISSILKWEGTIIDPVVAILTLLVYEVIISSGPEEALGSVAIIVIKTIAFGTSFGLFSSFALIFIMERHWCPDFLQESITLVLVFFAFVGSNVLQNESGLLAVTVMGIILGNQKIVSVKHIITFKENLTVILLSSVFIVLACRLNLQDLIPLLNINTAIFVLILILVARPISIFMSNRNTDLTRNEKIFMSFMAPRGIVCAAISSLFALELSHAGFEGTDQMVALTFFIIISTVTVYAVLANPLANYLKLARVQKKGIVIVGCDDFSIKLATVLQKHHVGVLLVDYNQNKASFAKSLDLNVYHGNILSADIQKRVVEGNYMKLLAMTSDDQSNLLILNEYMDKFGKNHVYRTFPENQSVINSKEDLFRFLFFNGPTHGELNNLTKHGSTIQTKTITKSFNLKNFISENPFAIPICIITKRNTVLLFIKGKPLIPRAGQTLVYISKD